MQPFDCNAFPFCWRPGPVVDSPVVLERAFKFLALVLELIEQGRLIVLLPDSDPLTDIPHEAELFKSFVAKKVLSARSQRLLPDDLLRRRQEGWRSSCQAGLCVCILKNLTH